MEELRIKGGAGDEVDSVPYHLLASNAELNSTPHTGFMLIIRQLFALFIKKWHIFKRDYLMYSFFVVSNCCYFMELKIIEQCRISL